MQTAVSLTLFLCVVLTAVGVSTVPFLLRMMTTPEDVFREAAEYLRIYFCGVTGVLLYNIGASTLRAVGDSTRPLYFLIFCTLLNTALDLLFVRVFSLGIAGAAWATVVSQCCSAFLVLRLLSRADTAYRLDIRHLHVQGSILRKICRIGLPSALQLAVTSFSNIFVQSYINRFASSCMAGWTAYIKIDTFAILPMMSLNLATSTFVGQNLGARNYTRARTAPRIALLMGFGIMIV